MSGPRMRHDEGRHQMINVPTLLQSRVFRGTNVPNGTNSDLKCPAESVRPSGMSRRPTACVSPAPNRALAAGQSRDVADTPRTRPRQSGVASLDGVSDRPLPVRAIRRARLRDDRLGCPRSLPRSTRTRSRDGYRGSSCRGPICTARYLARGGGVHCAAVSTRIALRVWCCAAVSRGALRRGDRDAERTYEAITVLANSWGSDNPSFRQVFTSRFIPEGTEEQLRWFNELCRKTTSPELAGTLLRSRAEADVRRFSGSAEPRWSFTRATMRSRPCPRAVCWHRKSRGAVRRARFSQSHPPGARAGVDALPGRRPRIQANGGHARVRPRV